MAKTIDTYVEIRFYGPTETKWHRAGIFRGGRRVAVLSEGENWEAVSWAEDAARAYFESQGVTVIDARSVYIPSGDTGTIVRVDVDSESYDAFIGREVDRIVNR